MWSQGCKRNFWISRRSLYKAKFWVFRHADFDCLLLVELSVAANDRKKWGNPAQWCCRAGIVLGVLGLVMLVGKAKKEADREETLAQEWNDIPVRPPSTPPPLSQESIDLALLFYGIRIPPGTEHPRFDKDLLDRGVTVKPTFYGSNKVGIGPEAFASWALLGSTLAHEIEVHCQQNLLGVFLLDLLGLEGTHLAERVAYLHEVRNKKRFGLKTDEESMILETLDFYYPEAWSMGQDDMAPNIFRGGFQRMAARSASFQMWLRKKMVGP